MNSVRITRFSHELWCLRVEAMVSSLCNPSFNWQSKYVKIGLGAILCFLNKRPEKTESAGDQNTRLGYASFHRDVDLRHTFQPIFVIYTVVFQLLFLHLSNALKTCELFNELVCQHFVR